MKRLLVTGGAGFIGSHIVHALVARGDRVRVLDDLSSGTRENLAGLEVGEPGSGAPVELLVGRVSDRAAVEAGCAGVDGVFHHAALVSVPDSVARPEASFEINVSGTFEVLRAARAAGVGGVVFASSSAVYGDDETVPKVETMAPRPISPYAGDKLTGETMLAVWSRSYGLASAALRYFNVFGPRQTDGSPYSGVIALFARACLAGESITVHGDGEQTRDFVFVEDVARANLLAMDACLGGTAEEPHSVLNVGSGEAVSINELYREVATCAGRGDAPAHGPARAGDVRHSRASIAEIRARLGFEPQVQRSAGLARTVDWYRERVEATRT